MEIQRDLYLNKIISYMWGGQVKVITGIGRCESPSAIGRIPKELPVLFASGKDDPVGSMGKGVERSYEGYRKAGIRDVRIKLDENDRHEILNELDKDTVYHDLLKWTEEHLPA